MGAATASPVVAGLAAAHGDQDLSVLKRTLVPTTKIGERWKGAMLPALQRVYAKALGRGKRVRLEFRRHWPCAARKIDMCRAAVGRYREWHHEVRGCVKSGDRAAKFHRMLPVVLLTFALFVAGVWMINWSANTLLRATDALLRFLAENFGQVSFYPVVPPLLTVVVFAVGFVATLRFQILPDIRSSTGWGKAAKVALGAVFAVAWMLVAVVTATRGVAAGIASGSGLSVSALLLGVWGFMICGFGWVFLGWFWLTKVVALRWPWMGWLIMALAWAFSVNIAQFLAENTKWLYPPNLHHAFDIVAIFGITAMEWYVKVPATFAAVVPWLVEFRMLRGLRRQGAGFRGGEYYQHWCKPARDEFPTIREMLKQSWVSLATGGLTPTSEDTSVRTMYRQLFRDIFR